MRNIAMSAGRGDALSVMFAGMFARDVETAQFVVEVWPKYRL